MKQEKGRNFSKGTVMTKARLIGDCVGKVLTSPLTNPLSWPFKVGGYIKGTIRQCKLVKDLTDEGK